MPLTAAITGPYGYLGTKIRGRLDAAGWSTVGLARQPRPGDRAIPWQLGEPLPEGALQGIDALVHCAYDFRPVREPDIWRSNVLGTKVLLDSAVGEGLSRLLVLSSMSAYPGTTQLYGRAKLAIEALTLERGGIAVRPGLVYGPSPGGMVGSILKLARLPIMPVIAPHARQFPVHEDDLTRVIVEILQSPGWIPEVVGIAQPRPLAFGEVLRALAARGHRSPVLCPVPWQLAYHGLRLTEAIGLGLGFRSDSIAGLVRPAPGVPRSAGQPDMLEGLRELRAPAARSWE
jgi:nucleoside-diphosphate-sugar epimerase